MKKILLATLLGAFSASQLMAVDLYITGSTAFRKQVFAACQNLFSGGNPATQYDTTKALGGDGTSTSSNPVWTMTGNAATSVTNLGGASFTIHANFTGSVQGCQTVENRVPIVFLKTDGTFVTNTPTIAFSDVSSKSTPYAVAGSYSEEEVAVQPFVMVKSTSTATAMNSITNITWEQIKSMHSLGSLPLSIWSGNAADYGTSVYILNRTKDSGTRRTTFAYVNAAFNETVTSYNYDVTNHTFYVPSGNALASAGEAAYAVIGGFAGYNNANLSWGPGYIGGGDIANAMKVNDVQNLSIAYLSLADAQKINTSINWSQVLPLNGVWPTAAGKAITSGTTTTNDFTPICAGFYGLWSYEVVVYPNVDPNSLSTDQNLTHAQLGSQTTPGTILGVLDRVTGSPIAGSIDYEIQNSKSVSPGATAIRLADMTSSRAAVGGPISP